MGLAALRAGERRFAIRQLEIALDFAPGHRKAMGCLGLALLEEGEPERARPWLARAGSSVLVARCDALLREGQMEEEVSLDALTEPPPVEPPPLQASSPVRIPPGEPGSSAPEPPDSPRLPETFELRGDHLLVRVRGDVVVRQAGLLAVRGGVRLSPEVKRHGGEPSLRPFGLGQRRMLRARGEGELAFRLSERLSVLDLHPASLYVREESLFAFGEGTTFDNGKLGLVGGPELALVRLTGPGRTVLSLRGALAELEVGPSTAARVLVPALVGWEGALEPRLVPLAEGGSHRGEEPLAVELRGEGRVLIDEGAAA